MQSVAFHRWRQCLRRQFSRATEQQEDISRKANFMRWNQMRLNRADKLHDLGVRDIPIFSHPIYDIPRLNRQTGFVYLNKVLYPNILQN